MNMKKKMSIALGLVLAVLVAGLVFANGSSAKNDEMTIKELVERLLPVQSHSEFINVMRESEDMSLSERMYFRSLLNADSQDVATYMEDFDFLTNFIYTELGEEFSQYFLSFRGCIADFYNLNDFTFPFFVFLILAAAAETLDLHEVEMPFWAAPISFLERAQRDFDWVIVAPNKTLIIYSTQN